MLSDQSADSEADDGQDATMNEGEDYDESGGENDEENVFSTIFVSASFQLKVRTQLWNHHLIVVVSNSMLMDGSSTIFPATMYL